MMVPNQEKSGALADPFRLSLSNFEGPYDLLLSLISRRQLDITDIALAEVTDEFLAYIRPLLEEGKQEALDRASDFLLTATTLLELKINRLLPQRSLAAEPTPAFLEARDLLFARLLQYRAYQQVASLLEEKLGQESQRFARSVALEPAFASILPELVLDLSPEAFAQLAARALSSGGDEEAPSRSLAEADYIYTPLTTIAAEEAALLSKLSQQAELSFEEACADARSKEVRVVRFLALLELYSRGRIQLRQEKPLGPISLSLLGEQAAHQTQQLEGVGA